ncbi:MAG: lipopolysaccharide heptosyltransferase II [bacterium]
MSDFKKIVIRGTNWLGDSVITIPAVRAVRELYPSASIDIVAPGNLADLWEDSGAVDRVIPVARPTDIREKLRIIGRLRECRYDLGVVFPNSFESALWFFLAGVRRCLGYATCGRGFLLNWRVQPPDGGGHQVHRYLNLVRAMGPIRTEAAPSIVIPERLRGWARDILREKGIAENDRIVGINPGSTYGPAKCWPQEKFAGLIRSLRERLGASVVVVGGKQERALTDALCRGRGKGIVDTAGETTVMQLAALLARCAVVVSNDTGPMHLACAVGTPVVAVIGPTDPVATGPLGRHLIVRSEVDCAPCFKRQCPTDHRCMTSIPVEMVCDAVMNLIR